MRSLIHATVGICTVFCLARANPVQMSANGHWYERVDKTINWQDAKTEAESLGGYLATVTSMEENIFLTINPELGNTPNYTDVLNPEHAPFADLLHYHWLGGFKDLLTTDPNDGWTWVNNEGKFDYNNWARALVDVNGDGVVPDLIEVAPGVWVPASVQTEPNNAFATPEIPLYENRLIYDHQFCPVNGKQWNDLNGEWLASGYVIEWDTNPASIPDGGSTLLLGGIAFAFVGLLRRRVRA